MAGFFDEVGMMTDHDRVVAIEAEMQRLRAQMDVQPQFWVRNLIRLAGLEEERTRLYGQLRVTAGRYDFGPVAVEAK
jgi:hypothetical protein